MTAASPLEFADGAAWERWLEARHEVAGEAWLRIGKRHAGIALLPISDALDGALCFGWIDGQRKGFDDVSFLQRYCRRRPRSTWSQVNVAKVAALTEAGRMRPAGLAEVAAAQADGRWQAAYQPQSEAVVPPDLAAALAGNSRAGAAFEQLGRSEQYTLILRLMKARTPEGRARTVDRVVAGLGK